MKDRLYNFMRLATSELTAKAVGFVTMVYLARVLGAEGFGIYGFVMALSLFAILFSNFGIEQFATRQIASTGVEDSGNMILSVILSRFLLSIVFAVLFVIIGLFYSTDNNQRTLFLFQSLFIVAFAFNLQFLLVATGSIALLSVIKSGTALLILFITLLVVHSPDDLSIVSLVSGGITLVVFGSVTVYFFIKNRWEITTPSFQEFRNLFAKAAPLGIAVFMIQIYRSSDIIILGYTNPGIELGYYTGAVRITSVLTLLPGLLYLIYIPFLGKITAGYFQSEYTRQYIFLLTVSGLIISSASALFAESFVTKILGDEFIPATGVFRVLQLNVFLVYINIAFAHLLIAWDQHRKYLRVVTAGAIVNIIVNIVLIPPYGIMGAAIATVLAECAVLSTTIYYHTQLYGLFSGNDREE